MLRIASMTSLVLVLVTGCVSVPGEAGEETTQQAIGGTGCQDDFCPKNSSVIDTFAFHELSVVPGQTNPEGFSLKFLKKGLLTYSVRVRDGRITGRHSLWGTISGGALANSQLWISRGAKDYVVFINGVLPVNMWAKLPLPALTPQIEAYYMNWANVVSGQPGREVHNVCEQAILRDGSQDLLGAPNFVTFVFEGERIDSVTKRIWDYDEKWFNIGCAGHILAKMYLMGHVGAADNNGYHTSIDDRQSMISNIGATYCGDGYSFTMPGQPWTVYDANKWMEYPGAPGGVKLEARWEAYAPKCLDKPRVQLHPTADTLALWGPDMDLAIEARCKRPPTCSDQDPWNLDGMHLASGHPMP
jgi:hypothetical protein